MHSKIHMLEFLAGWTVWEGCKDVRRWKTTKGKPLVCSQRIPLGSQFQYCSVSCLQWDVEILLYCVSLPQLCCGQAQRTKGQRTEPSEIMRLPPRSCFSQINATVFKVSLTQRLKNRRKIEEEEEEEQEEAGKKNPKIIVSTKLCWSYFEQ